MESELLNKLLLKESVQDIPIVYVVEIFTAILELMEDKDD